MKIGAKRFLSLMLCCIMVLGLFPATAFAEDQEDQTVTITKEWEDAGHESERPEKVTINLLNSSEKVIGTVTLPDSNGNWTGSFSKRLNVASIREVPVANYDVEYTKPRKEQISLSDWGNKIEAANIETYTLTKNIVVAKKGGDYYIWTETALTERNHM